MPASDKSDSLQSTRNKRRILLILLLSAAVLSVLAWQTYRSHIRQINVEEAKIDPIVLKVIEIKFKEYGEELNSLLARNLTETVNSLKSQDHFYGSESEVKTALTAMAAGDLSPVKTLIDNAAKKPGLDPIRSAEIQRNLGALGYFFEENTYYPEKNYDGWTPVFNNYEQAAKFDPNNINAWRNLGYLFLYRFAEHALNPPAPIEWPSGNMGTQPPPNFDEYRKFAAKSADAYAKVIHLSEKQNNPVELARGYYDLGRFYDRKSPATDEENEMSLAFYKKALSLYEDIDSPRDLANTYDKIAFLYFFTLNNYPQGVVYYEKALPLFKAFDDKEKMNNIYGNIGLVSWSAGNCAKSVESYENELKLLSSYTGNSEFLKQNYRDFNYSPLAECYERLGNLDKTLLYFKKSLEQSERKLSEQSSDYFLVQNATFSSRIGNIALKQGNTEEALTYFQKALSLNQKTGQQEGIAMAYIGLGDVYVKTGDKTKAKDAFNQGLENLKRLNNPPHLKELEDRINALSK